MLSEPSRITLYTLSNWRTNTTHPDTQTLIIIAQLLDIETTDLINKNLINIKCIS